MLCVEPSDFLNTIKPHIFESTGKQANDCTFGNISHIHGDVCNTIYAIGNVCALKCNWSVIAWHSAVLQDNNKLGAKLELGKCSFWLENRGARESFLSHWIHTMYCLYKLPAEVGSIRPRSWLEHKFLRDSNHRYLPHSFQHESFQPPKEPNTCVRSLMKTTGQPSSFPATLNKPSVTKL